MDQWQKKTQIQRDNRKMAEQGRGGAKLETGKRDKLAI